MTRGSWTTERIHWVQQQGSRIWRMLNADIDVDEGLKHQEASCCKMNGGLAISCDNRGHADVRLTGDPHWGENRWGVHPNSARTQLQVERYITNAATKQDNTNIGRVKTSGHKLGWTMQDNKCADGFNADAAKSNSQLSNNHQFTMAIKKSTREIPEQPDCSISGGIQQDPKGGGS